MHSLKQDYIDDLADITPYGVSISGSPFGNIEYVGTLLFEEYPTTAIYKDKDNNPIIREWVDCSNDGKVDRFYYFQIVRFDLLKFVKGESSHKDFVFGAINNVFHFVDVVDEHIISSKIVFKQNFPVFYAPGEAYKFTDSDGVDLDLIKGYFNLEKVDEAKIDSRVIDLANKSMVETFNLHLEEGHGIGFGIANTELLGNSLIKFNSLYEEATLDYFLGSNRDNTLSGQRRQLQHYTATEVYANVAASYSLLIRPASAKYDLFDDNKSSSEIVAGKIFQLFENAKDIDLLVKNYGEYSPGLIESFKLFLKTVQTNKIKLGFGWYNPHSESVYSEKLDYKVSHSILANIESLSTASTEVITKRGLFEKVHCNTSYFGFVSLDNIYFTGYLDSKITESIRFINFVDEYEVVIVQKTYEVSGRPEPKVENKIISYFKIPDDQRKSQEITNNG